MNKIQHRKAKATDINLYFEWLNDPEVREKSFDSNTIKWEEHYKWFNDNINNPNYTFYIFNFNKENIGQVRIHKIKENESEIGISIGIHYRGLGYGSQMLIDACYDYFNNYNAKIINAYIKNDNISSKKIFEKAGFTWIKNFLYNNYNTDHFVLYADRKL